MKIKGFTLIELVVVVVIIGVLAAVGVVAYNGYTESAKIKVVQKNYIILKKYIKAEVMKCELGATTAFEGTMNCSLSAGERLNATARSNLSPFAKVLENMFKNPYDNYYQVWSGSWGAVGVGRIGIDGDGANFVLCFNDPDKGGKCRGAIDIELIPAK
jgi:type IV pilus assembly protein PilA